MASRAKTTILDIAREAGVSRSTVSLVLQGSGLIRPETALKVRKAIDAGDKGAAQAVFKESQSVIDSIADKNIVHKNLAARQKSRLSAAIKAL